jgi:hypothetical protein
MGKVGFRGFALGPESGRVGPAHRISANEFYAPKYFVTYIR